MKLNKIFILSILLLSFSVPVIFATSFAILHLDTVSNSRESESIVFSGQLTDLDGTAIPHRTIFIEDDTSYTRPDIILTITTTDSNGKFSVPWKIIPKDNNNPFHIYAKFIGGKAFGYARSETYEQYIQPSSTSTNSDVVPPKTIPTWFKNASKMWYDGQIRDLDYSYGIKNLIDYGIIKSSISINSELKFPTWLKNDALWFYEGNISNDEYSNMLEYILENKMLFIS